MLDPLEEIEPGNSLVEVVPRAAIRTGEWTVFAPNPGLQPDFAIEPDGSGGIAMIRAQGNGSQGCFGYASCPVRIEGGRSYRLHVKFTTQGLERPDHQLVHGIYGPGFSAGVQAIRKDGEFYIGEACFEAPPVSLDAELRLYFRYSARGEVVWHDVRIEECEPLPPRIVTVVCRQGAMPPGSTLEFWDRWLDCAGALAPDIVLLPEMFDDSTPATAAPPGGPAVALLARKAREWGMYTCGAVYERRDDLVYNSAPLFDRHGVLAGTYDKRMPYDPELDEGVVPGTGPGVFETDFGRVGILTCYDSWFPETARHLAMQGAELVLLPNAGYWLQLMPARAADNGFSIAASSILFAAGVWDSSGACAGETVSDLSRQAPSAILSCDVDLALGLLLARVDLGRKYSPHWKGGPMLSAPAARPYRQTSVCPVCRSLSAIPDSAILNRSNS
jgi:predicted amidohydrolase